MYCVLSEKTQRRALSPYQSYEVKIFHFLVGFEPTTHRVYSHTLVSLRQDWPQECFLHYLLKYRIIYIFLNGGDSDTLGVRESRLMFGLSYSSMDIARDILRSTPGGGREVSWLCP